jgi:hypothetical protein
MKIIAGQYTGNIRAIYGHPCRSSCDRLAEREPCGSLGTLLNWAIN